MIRPGLDRRAALGLGAAALLAVALWRNLPDPEAPTPDEDEIRDPTWGVAPGQVYELAHAGISRIVTISSVLPPTHDTPYLRVAVLVGMSDQETIDLQPTDRPGDGFVPVGAPAEDLSAGQALSQVGTLVDSGQSIITPGYVMVVPADRPRDDEPVRAGFRRRSGTVVPPPMNGYARLLTWAELGQRLRR